MGGIRKYYTIFPWIKYNNYSHSDYNKFTIKHKIVYFSFKVNNILIFLNNNI